MLGEHAVGISAAKTQVGRQGDGAGIVEWFNDHGVGLGKKAGSCRQLVLLNHGELYAFFFSKRIERQDAIFSITIGIEFN
jgi:hypothetical protein